MDRNREAAYKILLKIDKEGSFSNLAIKEFLSDKKDIDHFSAPLIRRLVYGVLEKRFSIDYFLDKLINKGIKGTKPEVLEILRLGAYQLSYMDNVPDYAAIHSSVDLTKKYKRGLDGFVNGVLRNWQRKKDSILLPDKDTDHQKYLSIKYSCHPDIVSLLIDQRGHKEAELILQGLDGDERKKGISLRVKGSVEAIIDYYSSDGYEVSLGSLSRRVIHLKKDDYQDSITDSLPYRDGLVSIQSEESCWIADLCEPNPGDRVLDVCAAPGGKTLAMAEVMNNSGEIIATDLYEHRLNLLEKNAKRLGINIVHTMCMDATKPFNGNEFVEPFDLVLVDAPCSGLGVMGKKPEIRLRKPEGEALVPIQRCILENASEMVKKGGLLVYSTCTIDKRENEDIVKNFLSENKGFQLEYEKQLLPLGEDEDSYDGFYLARLRKNK